MPQYFHHHEVQLIILKLLIVPQWIKILNIIDSYKLHLLVQILKLLCFYRSGDEILLNSSAGHLVRSKPASDGEGGCFNGAGALDSIILTS